MKKYKHRFIVGVDTEETDRFSKFSLKEHKYFLNGIFTESELRYCFSKSIPSLHLAARFAGKEAVLKALRLRKIIPSDFKRIEILNNRIGAPVVIFHSEKFRGLNAQISLTHSNKQAVAFALLKEGYA